MSEGYILDEPYATEMKGCLVSTKDYINILRNKCRDLQQKVEQLEKDFKETNNLALNLISKNKQLENIRKEAIKYINKHSNNLAEYLDVYEVKDLLNILNKGSDKDV